MNPLEYYGIDWVIFALFAAHIWLIGNRKRGAFLVAILGNILGLIFGSMCDSLATVSMNTIFAVLNARAYYKWK